MVTLPLVTTAQEHQFIIDRDAQSRAGNMDNIVEVIKHVEGVSPARKFSLTFVHANGRREFFPAHVNS